MSRAKNHEQLILGDAFEKILGYQGFIQTVTESQFRLYLLPLLKNPYKKENMAEYVKVAQELIRPVNVVADQDRNQVLFTIPPLTPPPNTGIPSKGGLTADEFLTSLKREIELGGRGTPEKVSEFMKKITQFPDIVQVVILPLRAILQRYGEDFEVPEFRGESSTTIAEAPSHLPAPGQSSFSDEYD